VVRDPTAEREFRDFVAAGSASLQRTAYLLTGDWAAAEDLVQTALMKTYLVWSRRGGIESVERYARKVMVNTATSWRRRKWRGERPAAEMPERPHADGAEMWLERDADLPERTPARPRRALSRLIVPPIGAVGKCRRSASSP
jgi:DNA-directed RNA polymerase specialized sigma24 family protein